MILDSETLEIRPFRAGEESGVVSLFGRAFGRQIDVDHWRWKLNHPGVETPNVMLAVAQGRPVFHYAGIPTRMLMDGSPETSMVSVDTMTDPDFRRRGLLTKVAAETYAQWSAAGMGLMFGLPNEQWGSRKAALGFHLLFRLQRMLRPLRPEVTLARRWARPWVAKQHFVGSMWNSLCAVPHARDESISIRTVTTAGVEFDSLWERCREDARFCVVRDSRWVQWRFLSCPSRRYEVRLALRGNEPVGYSAHYVREEGGQRIAFLAELSTPRVDERARETLLLDLLKHLNLQGVEYVSTLAIPSSELHRSLRRHAFFGGHCFTVEAVPLATRASVEALGDPANWELSGAAFDVI